MMKTNGRGKGVYSFTLFGGPGGTVWKFNPIGDVEVGMSVSEAGNKEHDIS